jgi:hypothetical protein
MSVASSPTTHNPYPYPKSCRPSPQTKKSYPTCHIITSPNHKTLPPLSPCPSWAVNIRAFLLSRLLNLLLDPPPPLRPTHWLLPGPRMIVQLLGVVPSIIPGAPFPPTSQSFVLLSRSRSRSIVRRRGPHLDDCLPRLSVVVLVVVEDDDGTVCCFGCRVRETVGCEDLGGGSWRDGRAEVAEGALLEDVAAEEERRSAEDD